MIFSNSVYCQEKVDFRDDWKNYILSNKNLTDEQKQIVKERMEGQGFTFHFIRENENSYSFWNGTRFCFTKNN
jgi:hypothetical protein